jgi:hypothetical protein
MVGRRQQYVDRSTVNFVSARRIERGIEVYVLYPTSKTTTGTGNYSMQIIINTEKKNVEYYNRKAGTDSLLQKEPEQRRQIAEELRDMFLGLPAWEHLRNRQIAYNYIVDAEGKQRGVTASS